MVGSIAPFDGVKGHHRHRDGCKQPSKHVCLRSAKTPRSGTSQSIRRRLRRTCSAPRRFLPALGPAGHQGSSRYTAEHASPALTSRACGTSKGHGTVKVPDRWVHLQLSGRCDPARCTRSCAVPKTDLLLYKAFATAASRL